MPGYNPQHALLHQEITHSFTQRYIDSVRFKGIHLARPVAHAAPYDPANEYCDYDRTSFDAQPTAHSLLIGMHAVAWFHGLTPKQLDRLQLEPARRVAPALRHTLLEGPAMVVNDHHAPFQAAMSMFALNVAMAEIGHGGTFQERLLHNFANSHVVATRSMGPLMVGNKYVGPKYPLPSLGRKIMNVQFSIPNNDAVHGSQMVNDFRRTYNKQFKATSIAIAQAAPTHPEGLYSFWSVAGSDTSEKKRDGKVIIPEIAASSIELMHHMGVSLLNNLTTLGPNKKRVPSEYEEIVPAEDVTGTVVRGMLFTKAGWRRAHGEDRVFYAEELAA